jgi:branched-chain amino acid aminotransferase
VTLAGGGTIGGVTGERGVSLALAGSIRNVAPVVSLDGQDVVPGPLVVAAQELFGRRLAEGIDP